MHSRTGKLLHFTTEILFVLFMLFHTGTISNILEYSVVLGLRNMRLLEELKYSTTYMLLLCSNKEMWFFIKGGRGVFSTLFSRRL